MLRQTPGYLAQLSEGGVRDLVFFLFPGLRILRHFV
jgi:hypothetical protein